MSSTLTVWIRSNTLVILFGVSLLFSGQSFGQVVQSSRFEFPLSREEAFFEVIPAESKGLILQRRLKTPTSDNLEIIKLDTAFQHEWQGYLPIDPRLNLVSKRIVNGRLYLLLRDQLLTRKDFVLYNLDIQNGTVSSYIVKNFIPFNPSDFQITDHAAIIGGYFNATPVLVYFSFASQKAKVLPGLFNEAGELTQIKTNRDGSFDVLISAKKLGGQKTIWIKNYDPEGNLVNNYPLQNEGNRNLVFARSVKTNNDMQLVAGVYGSRNSIYSKGIFIARVDPEGYQQLKYYNYADLHNFFKYMKVKREQRVKGRIERRRIKGKKTKFNYRFMVHEIVPFGDQFVLLGEAFYPQYTSIDRASANGFFSPNNFSNTMIRDGRVFDGYRYTHAVVIGFDSSGKVIWDNSFEINDVKTFTLEQFVKLEIHDDRIALLYLFQNDLRSKIIQGNTVVEGKTFQPLRSDLNHNVKVNRATVSKLDYWYDNYFFAFGVQEVDLPIGKQKIFFINKITYAD